MNYSFNVEEFTQIVDSVTNKSTAAEETLLKISSYIETLMTYIGDKENPSLYQSWAELKENIDKVHQKYVERKNAFLSELSNFKETTLMNNDEVYQSISEANQHILAIVQQLENLQLRGYVRLTEKEVSEAKKVLNDIVTSNNQLLNLKDISKKVSKDDDFSSFANGTLLGVDLQAELNELLSLIIDEVYNKVDSINQYTLNFLNSRENIDNASSEEK